MNHDEADMPDALCDRYPHDEAYMMGDVAGFDDGYSGDPYNSTPPASVGLDLQGVYRAAYLEAYAAGQSMLVAGTMES